MSEKEISQWIEYIKTVKPLLKKTDKIVPDIPPCLRAYRQVREGIKYELDLHGLTLEEAYRTVKLFIDVHIRHNTQKIRIITGKGIQGKGKIKNEIALWLETPFFRDKVMEINWLNDGGVLEIRLRRNKKCRMKK
ncbi:MAG: Smr/MutS family protein [Alphaproteobacteria bacterium]|nr:Smr/MutS family protein [Alphaproteobacteria bacterium]